MYKSCEICGADNWDLVVYEGAVRSGSFGTRTEGGRILRCGGCGADRLDEEVSIARASYESDEYRTVMDQGLKVEDFFNQSDPGQIYNLSAVWPLNLRDKVLADIGCGAGSFLSHVSALVWQSTSWLSSLLNVIIVHFEKVVMLFLATLPMH